MKQQKYICRMDKQKVIFRDLGKMDYKRAWDYEARLLQQNVRTKSLVNSQESIVMSGTANNNESELTTIDSRLMTEHHLLFVEHPPVYTLGKSGSIDNVLMTESELEENGIQFFR